MFDSVKASSPTATKSSVALPNTRPAAACQLSSVPEIWQGNAVSAVGGSWRRTPGPPERMLCAASASLHSTGQLPQHQFQGHSCNSCHATSFLCLKIIQHRPQLGPVMHVRHIGMSKKRLTLRRWQSLVIVTNSFHQLRSFLTFQCAVRQSQPHHRQMKARSTAVAF